MSLEYQDLIVRMLFTDTRRHVLALVRSNPEDEFSVDQISRSIKHPSERIQCDITGLTDLGLLKCRRVGENEFFSLDREGDQAIQKTICEGIRAKTHRRLPPCPP